MVALSHLIKNEEFWATLSLITIPVENSTKMRDDAYLLVDSPTPMGLGHVFNKQRPAEAVKILTKMSKDMVLVRLGTTLVTYLDFKSNQPVLLWVSKFIDQQDLLIILSWALNLRGDLDVCGMEILNY